MKEEFFHQEIECKSAMNHIKTSRLPYSWDLNIYRGCEHHCQYCFAMYTHSYMSNQDFFNYLYIKKNIVLQLEKKLASKSWKREIINLGGVTDNYQLVEEKYQIMPQILKLMIKYKNPIIISTKSTLILRDLELIKELSRVATVNIAFTITTLDEKIAKMIEPGASLPLEKLQALKRIKLETDAIVGIHCMPMIPYLTATKSNLESLFYAASTVKVDYCIPALLGLRGVTRKNFLTFFKKNYPALYPKLYHLYQNPKDKKEYTRLFYKLLYSFKEKYQISLDYNSLLKEKSDKFTEEQLSFSFLITKK